MLSAAQHTLILASASKVRGQMLSHAGVDFDVEVSNVDEERIKSRAGDKPVEEIAAALAIAKAQAVSANNPGALVIGADQILECDGALFDKPNGRAGAVTHLQNLSGKLHRLITSACVVQGGEVQWQSTDGVRLTMRELSADFIESYLDAAGDGVLASVGAYRLEDIGAQLFTRVEGDYFTVLGLPLLPLLQFLRDRKVLPE
ncbi:MAG: Maf family nucleotide pyrophosphatase [Rhodospirillales bacterium]